MRHVHSDPELQDLVRRFVTPDRRYRRLGGSLLRLSQAERSGFARELAQAACEITPAELGILFEGGWRERKTASWLVAVAHRTKFRDLIGQLLLASEGPYAGAAYCVTFAKFGTRADVELLCGYLDHYLSRPDLGYDSPFSTRYPTRAAPAGPATGPGSCSPTAATTTTSTAACCGNGASSRSSPDAAHRTAPDSAPSAG